MTGSQDTPKTWLLTGASRGLGLEFTRQLIQSPHNTVFATCRSPSTATLLKQVTESPNVKGTVHVIQLDQDREESVLEAAKKVGEILGDKGRIDYLLNNAGVDHSKGDKPSTLNRDGFISTMASNVLGSALVTQAFIPYVLRGEEGERRLVLNMTSGLSSLNLVNDARLTSYSISKAAVNMLTRHQVHEYPSVIFLTVDPGWVKTDMGGPGAQLEPEFAIGSVLKVLVDAEKKDTGSFLRYDGTTLPW